MRCPTLKYNRRVRAGRGFSLAELKAAGIPRKQASTIGIAVDPRRQNLSEEGLKANVERLNAYKARLILFPRNAKTPKAGEAPASDAKAAKEAKYDGSVEFTKKAFPVVNDITVKEGKVADFESEPAAYRKLRDARSTARLAGKREKRAKAKAEEAAASKK